MLQLLVPPTLLAFAAFAATLPSNWVVAQVVIFGAVACASLGAFPSAGDQTPLRGIAPIAATVMLVGLTTFLAGGTHLISNVLV